MKRKLIILLFPILVSTPVLSRAKVHHPQFANLHGRDHGQWPQRRYALGRNGQRATGRRAGTTGRCGQFTHSLQWVFAHYICDRECGPVTASHTQCHADGQFVHQRFVSSSSEQQLQHLDKWPLNGQSWSWPQTLLQPNRSFCEQDCPLVLEVPQIPFKPNFFFYNYTSFIKVSIT